MSEYICYDKKDKSVCENVGGESMFITGKIISLLTHYNNSNNNKSSNNIIASD